MIFGKGYVLKEPADAKAVILSSGRGVHEALNTAKLLEQTGILAGVVDMPSIDAKLLRALYDSGKLLVFAEQNNGYIWSECRKILFKHYTTIDATRLLPINALNAEGNLSLFIQPLTSSLSSNLAWLQSNWLKQFRANCNSETTRISHNQG